MINLSDFKEGDLLLVHTNSFFSSLIRSLTRSYWNHVGILVSDNKLTVTHVIEATLIGVKKTPIKNYIENKKEYSLAIVRVSKEAYENDKQYEYARQCAILHAYNQVGKKYDYSALIWLGIAYFFKGRCRFNPLNRRERVICSELVCQCWNFFTNKKVKNIFAGDHYPDVDCSTITPKDIYKSIYTRKIYTNREINMLKNL